MQQILNHMKIQAAMGRGAAIQTRMGLVDSYDPDTYSCKVRLQPEDPDNPSASLTGWLPVSSVWVGNGFGILAPPAYDQMVLVYFIDGDVDSGVVGPSMFNDLVRPPRVEQGECWILHESGSSLKFLNDGTISTSATINHEGDLNVNGNITSTGDIQDNKGTMETMRTQHNMHTHPVQNSVAVAPTVGRME